MSTITSIRLWYDTGFTEGCTEVPKINGSLPSPSLAYDASFTPSTSDIFSRLKLRVPYTTLMNCSYLSIALDMKNGTDKLFYGWIDRVNIISDTESNPLTEILWHVDLWRTYISSVTVGSGMVNRRPLLTNDSVPPQPYPYRSVSVEGDPIYFRDWDGTTNGDSWTVIFTYNYNYKTEDSTSPEGVVTPGINYSSTGIGSFPVSRSSPNARQSVGSYTAPSMFDVMNGTWDELIGLDPESIKGVFLIPTTNVVDGYLTSAFKIAQPSSAECGFYKATGLAIGTLGASAMTLPSTLMTDDVNTYYITGFDGEIIGSLPWGIPVSQIMYTIIVESSSAYIQLRCGDEKSHVEGTCFTIPLPTLEVSANGWSSYVYSGARSADIEQRQLEAEQARESTYLSTLTGVGSSITNAGMMGALAGGPIGAIGSAAAGGVSTIISGTIGAEMNYNLTTKYNDSFQGITDYRKARQTNGLLMSGVGFNCLCTGRRPAIFKAVKDAYSVQQRANDISLYGVHVSEPRSSCQSLIQQGGPIQITNAVVTGSVPVEAKQYIRQRLAQGVRMI